jgi:hypothetical protein
MKVKLLNDMIGDVYSINERYCREIISENEAFEKGKEFSLEKSCLYSDLISCKSQLEIIETYVSYFCLIYVCMSHFIRLEQFEKAALLRDSIRIDKKICLHYFDALDDDLLKHIEYCQKEIMKLYKII